VLPDRSTVSEYLAPQIADAYSNGGIPPPFPFYEDHNG
jgi:hypothetical protein